MADFHPLAQDTPCDADEPIEAAFKGKRPDPPSRGLPDVPKTSAGVASLLRAGAYRHALNLAGQVLDTAASEPHEKLLAWSHKVAALLALRMADEAASELEAIGDLDAPAYMFEAYPQRYPGRRGSMVPFSLRLSKAQLLCSSGRQRSFLPLYSLLEWVQQQGRERAAEEAAAWTAREDYVECAIAARYVQGQDYASAVAALERVVARRPRDAALLSAVGRVYLQAGALGPADAYFREAERQGGSAGSVAGCSNRGAMKLARDEYSPAIEMFLAAAAAAGGGAAAQNNAAVAMFYNGNLTHALAALREAASREPFSVDDAVESNLCALYDFASDSAEPKKAELHAYLARTCPERWGASKQ